MFEFLNYTFDEKTYRAEFSYRNLGLVFTEKVQFVKPENPAENPELLDRALFLAFILIGTSYYKVHPTPEVILRAPLDSFQAEFFTHVYQDGLSQFAFENGLKRENLATFSPTTKEPQVKESPKLEKPINLSNKKLSLQSGGKDSLLLSELFPTDTYFYLSSHETTHPAVLDRLENLQVATRIIDRENLKKAENLGGLNGHVPVTFIVESLALVQAILNGQSAVLAALGREGEESSATVGDLEINHQWSKTLAAENLLQKYVKTYLSPDLSVSSPLRNYRELDIAKLFAEKCWQKYGRDFSSCNVANYRQGIINEHLTWCGRCPKCANSFLLFSPFIEPEEQKALFGENLFAVPELFETFKGLLGVENVMKPFECVGEVAELREAYRKKLPGYADLPFEVL